MLSFISLHKNNDWKQHSYVSLCGLSEQAMLKQLEINPQIKKVVLCLDNDKAGINACEKFENLLYEQGILASRISPTLKDFNEDLQEHQREQTHEMSLKMA
ncbi:toprim domain-containing protein [Clostridium sporogenes]|uniref:toprim domain-containing protein n=1 Tax=Clostridium sporogenes TaxID=1509 RepID=UPI003CC7DA5B